MEFQDQNEQEPVPEAGDVGSLEDVRTALVEDVVQFLAVAAPTSSDPDITPPGQSNASAGQRQALLCAAVADVEAIDERLDHARP